VIGLAYYVRAARSLFGAPAATSDRPARWPAFVLVAATAVALVVGLLPQVVFDATDLVVGR
jgi:NADH:ubiquinone oxidoreductase subunit 2 (subunit N)